MASGVTSKEIDDWTIQASKKTILSAAETADWDLKLGSPLPEMVFGNNHVKFIHKPSNTEISFNSFDSLNACRSSPGVRVRGSEAWEKQYHC